MNAPLLTARQAAETLAVSSETVLRWIRRGQLPAVRLPGGAVRVRPEALEKWLMEQETNSNPSQPRRW